MTTFDVYNAALADELLPAMGCTEPIALAYAGAICAKRLGGFPETIRVEVSRNIIKNVKSVVVPNTEGLRGIEAAVVAGLVSARPEAALEVLSGVTPDEKKEIHERLASQKMEVVPSDEPDVFFIRLTTTRAGKTVTVVIRTSHTNVTRIEEDGEAVFLKNDHAEEEDAPELWHISELIRAARTMPLDVSRPLLERQIAANMAIAEEGLKTQIGRAHV